MSIRKRGKTKITKKADLTYLTGWEAGLLVCGGDIYGNLWGNLSGFHGMGAATIVHRDLFFILYRFRFSLCFFWVLTRSGVLTMKGGETGKGD